MKVKEMSDEEICTISTALSFYSMSEKSEDFEFRDCINDLLEKLQEGRVFVYEKKKNK